MNVNPIEHTKRSPVAFWLVGGALLVLALWGFNHVVQSNASNAARTASRIASSKVEKAQHDQTVKDYHANLLRCARGNVLRAAIRTNTRNLAQFEEAVAQVRAGQAKTEVTQAGRIHDLASAAKYRKLIRGLRYVSDIDCARTYPDPFGSQEHR